MFKIKIDTYCIAADDREQEIHRILQRVAVGVCAGETSVKCMDINGNSIGDWELQ